MPSKASFLPDSFILVVIIVIQTAQVISVSINSTAGNCFDVLSVSLQILPVVGVHLQLLQVVSVDICSVVYT